ncbi:MAG: hypothetical protein B7X04_00315 [Parcubacteria group bacterium 21-54-25]|nr:MAG: hypothetical protein B7X04_00315 [Parcubacteria group bacterium 21-54-25]HQU07498.1 hypothetical protein [Candidatus Paceibacterota bacterium]
MQDKPEPSAAKMPYVLEFAKFLGIFIVMIGAALSLLHVIWVATQGNQTNASAAVAPAVSRGGH